MTQEPIRLLGIGGSVRAESITRNVLAEVLQLAEPEGATTDLISTHDMQLPVYDESFPLEEQPESLRNLLEKVKQADGFLLASPTYHHTMAASFKNVLDAMHILRGADRTYFDYRPVGLIAYGGPTAINSITTLIFTARGMRGLVVPTSLTVNRSQLNEARTQIEDETTRDRAKLLVSEVLNVARWRKSGES